MSGEDLSLFLHRVRDFVQRPVVSGQAAEPVRALARRMVEARVGSVVIVGADGAPTAIVTDRDLRTKVVAAGRDPATTPAGEIMSTPLVTLTPDAYAFEALLLMTRHEIHHVVLVDGGRLAGVVSSHDLLRLQAVHPTVLAREIAAAGSVEALARLGGRVAQLVRRLVEQGGTPYDVGRIVAELNDRTVRRVLELAVGDEPEGLPRFCWLAFGSEARAEQTLWTDQDNGLVYDDPAPDEAAAVAARCARLADRVNAALITIGFPECPGRIMARNPEWCQPAGVWAQRFRRWMRESGPEELLAAAIFFDVRPVGGTEALGVGLREVICREAPEARRFLGLLAREVVDRALPLTVFGNVRVSGDGPHRGTVDLKGGGVMQGVGAARVHALALGLGETNTVDRFRAAAARGLYGEEEVREITDAYQHLQRLRLVRQLDCLAAGAPPDNRVAPKRLSHADRLLLRDALGTMGRVQAGLRERYATDFLV